MSLELDLASVYRTEGDVASQLGRYRQALALFRETYGPGDVSVFRAPGRVNLIGEHTDYSHGYVLPVALDRDVLIFCRERADRQIRLANVEPRFEPSAFALSDDIAPSEPGHWANYAKGPAQWLYRAYGDAVRGMDALIDGQPPWGVPRGAGLSSSSALVVANAAALVALNGLPIAGAELADACGQSEWYVGTRGGVMDQFIAIMGASGQGLFLDCRPDTETGNYSWEHVPLPEGYSLVVVDSQVPHRNTANAFNQRVAECRIGAALLARHVPGLKHLRDAEAVGWDGVAHWLPETMTLREVDAIGIDLRQLMDGGRVPEIDTFYIRKRCRHVVTENERVRQAVGAMRDGDMPTLVALLRQAHASARDDYEISVPEIEDLVDLATELDPRIGARLTGAGWGGCVIALCPDELMPALAARLDGYYATRPGREPSYSTCRAANGAGLVHRTTL